MTGGQPLDGAARPCRRSSRQVAAEGVKRIVVVTDEPEKYPATPTSRRGVDDPPPRRARRGAARAARDAGRHGARSTTRPAPPRSAAAASAASFPIRPSASFINERGLRGLRRLRREVQLPVGRAAGDRVRPQAQHRPVAPATRTTPASKGFCPSFVTVEGGALRKRAGRRRRSSARCRATLPEPALPALDRALRHPGHRHRRHRRGHHRRAARHGRAPRGQGRVGARHDRPGAEGRRGAVARAHRARRPSDLHATRIAAGEADLVLGCDLVVAAGNEALAKMQHGRHARARQHRQVMPTATSCATPTWQFPLRRRWSTRSTTPSAPATREFVDATAARHRADGRLHRDQHVHARLRLAGGLVPLSEAAIADARSS